MTGWERKCSQCGIDYILNLKAYNTWGNTDDWSNTAADLSSLCDSCKAERVNTEVKKKITKIIPPKFWAIETDKKDLLLKYKDKSVFCWGATGTGKSVFVHSLAKGYIKRARDILIYSYPALIMQLRNAYKTDSGKTPWDIAKTTADFRGVLILDDLGAEKTTDFVKEITYFILNERELNLLTTIITSNYSLNELNDRIDSRVSSRIAGMCEILKFTGKDKRIKRNQN